MRDLAGRTGYRISPLTIGLGRQDPTYGGSSSTPGVGNGLDGVPDLAYFNTVNPTTTSQTQWNGRLDANVTQNDRVSFAIYWVPVAQTNFSGPVRASNFWHHDQTNRCLLRHLAPYILSNAAEPGTRQRCRLAL